MDSRLALRWILFLGLFPLSFIWLRRAWQIIVRHDYSEVALKGGEPPADAARFAPYTAAVDLIAGGIMAAVILLVLGAFIDYETWTAVAGSTIWLKFIADYIVSRHAHPILKRKSSEK